MVAVAGRAKAAWWPGWSEGLGCRSPRPLCARSGVTALDVASTQGSAQAVVGIRIAPLLRRERHHEPGLFQSAGRFGVPWMRRATNLL